MMLQFISTINKSLVFLPQVLCFQRICNYLSSLRKPYSFDFVTLSTKMLLEISLKLYVLILMIYTP